MIQALGAEAITPRSLAIREPTLDDVFLQLTGHRAVTKAAPEFAFENSHLVEQLEETA